MSRIRLLTVMLLLAPAAVTAASYDLENLGAPRFVNTNYIDVSKIFLLSKFRSSAGHDYSDNFESCRSMKHYFMVPDTSTVIVAPVSGTVTALLNDFIGTQVQITADAQPAFTLILFHVQLQSPLTQGQRVAEGQVLGVHAGQENFSDIAVRVDTPQGLRLVSYFETLTDAAFAVFKARGISSPAQLIISKAQRDAAPYQCTGQPLTVLKFANLKSPPDLDYISLTGAAPPTGMPLVTGPLQQRTLNLLVSPPPQVRNLIGSIFVAVVLPASQGGHAFLRTQSGSWVPASDCTTAPAAWQGMLLTGIGFDVFSQAVDLSAYRGTVFYTGFGIGSTWQLACNNMLQSQSFTTAYTVQ
ncbi:MAG: hypothetical protein EXR84_00055 [Gammaproteobacteria bacterium]|nr:hypothetical protein [Gammaproteobacteria bacterium]